MELAASGALAAVVGSAFSQLVVTQTVAGIVLGGVFALAAVGIVLIYRVTGVLNFAHGAMGMYSTFVAWWLLNQFHPLARSSQEAFQDLKSIGVAVLGALLFSLVLGVLLENLVFRWLRGRPQLVKAVITVGLLLVLQSAASIQFGSTQYHEAIRFFDPSRCGTNSSCYTLVVGDFRIGYDQLLVVFAALFLAGGLAVFLQFSRFGKAMRAVSDDPVAASLWGVPVNMVGTVSWMLGSLIAAIGGILLISIGINFDSVSLTIIVVDALAAALIGGLVSLPLTVLGGFGLGLVEQYPRIWIQSTGLPRAVAFLVILVALLVRSEKSLLRAKS
jgi:branched-subunit amino acid ABC-type transport system permease component